MFVSTMPEYRRATPQTWTGSRR